jgi:hypothetical protein
MLALEQIILCMVHKKQTYNTRVLEHLIKDKMLYRCTVNHYIGDTGTPTIDCAYSDIDGIGVIDRHLITSMDECEEQRFFNIHPHSHYIYAIKVDGKYERVIIVTVGCYRTYANVYCGVTELYQEFVSAAKQFETKGEYNSWKGFYPNQYPLFKSLSLEAK